MPGKRVQTVDVIHFPIYNHIRATIGYTPTDGNFESVVMRFDCGHFAGRALAERKVKMLAQKCHEDRHGQIRPYMAGLVGWMWTRTPERLEGS